MCRSAISVHRPITAHSCLWECQTELEILKKMNLEKKKKEELQNFDKKRKRSEANGLVTLSHETSMHA